MAYDNDKLPEELDEAIDAGTNDYFVVQVEGENKLSKISRSNLAKSETGTNKGVIQGVGFDPELRVDFETPLNGDYIVLTTPFSGGFQCAFNVYGQDSQGFTIKLYNNETQNYIIQYSAELI